MHWAMMLRFYADQLLSANRGLSDPLLGQVLVRLLDMRAGRVVVAGKRQGPRLGARHDLAAMVAQDVLVARRDDRLGKLRCQEAAQPADPFQLADLGGHFGLEALVQRVHLVAQTIEPLEEGVELAVVQVLSVLWHGLDFSRGFVPPA